MSDAKKAKKSIVIVTGNKNKLAEFKQILGNEFPYEVSSDGETKLCLGRRFRYCFDSLRPSQQFFSHVWTGLPGLNQY